MARYGVGDISSFVSCKKGIVCLTLSEKRTSEASWVVALFSPCRLLAGGIFVSNGPIHHVGLRYVSYNWWVRETFFCSGQWIEAEWHTS